MSKQKRLRRRNLALAVAGVAMLPLQVLADTTQTVNNGSTDLTSASSYTPSTPPTSSTDVVFTGTYTTTAFTINSNLSVATLNDLGTPALTIDNKNTTADTLTLNGGTDGATGAAASDLLYVASGSGLSIGTASTAALGLVLGTSGNIDVAGTSTLTLGLNTALSGAVSLTKTGTGTLVLNDIANTEGGSGYTFTVEAGTLQIGSNGTTAANFGDAATTIVLGDATVANVTLALSAGGKTGSYANPILISAGGGTKTLNDTSGVFTFSGPMTADSNLLINNTNGATSALTFTGGVTTDAGNTANLTLNGSGVGGTIVFSGASVNNSGSITNIGTSSTATVTINSVIGSNVTGVTENAASTMVLSGANQYTGPSISMRGTLEFTTEASLYADNSTGNWTSSNIVAQSGATLAFEVGNTGGFTSSDIATLLGLSTANGGFENGSLLGIDTTGGNFTYTGNGGVISNTNGGSNSLGLAKLGANSLILTGAQTYTGPTSIYAGTLQITGSGSLGTGLYSASILNNGTFEDSSTAAQTISGSIGGTGALKKDTGTSSALTLSATNFFTGQTTISAGTLVLKNSLALVNSYLSTTGVVFDSSVTSNAFSVGALGSFPLTLQNNAGQPITLTVGSVMTNQNNTDTGVLSGTGGLTVNGFSESSKWEGANTYTGATTVMGISLDLGGTTANGSISSSSPLVLGGVSGGGTLAYTRVSGTTTETQTFNGTTVTQGGNAVTTSTAYQTLNLGALTNVPGGTVDINPNTTSTITTTSPNVNGIIGGFATFGGKATWAVAPATAGGAITGLSTYTKASAAGATPANYTANNIDMDASATPTGPITPNSIRFSAASAYTLTLTGTNTIQSGGILVGSGATAGGTITGGTLLGTPSGQLAISFGTNQVLTIASLIGDNGGPSAVANSGNNSGRQLTLSNPNNSFSGGFYFNGGGVNVPTTGGALAAGGTALGVGDVFFGNSSVYTGVAGGGIVFGTYTYVLSSGLLSAADGNNTSNGDISGNSGGIWNLLGKPNDVQTFAGIVGSYAGGRVANFNVESGTQIIGNTQIGSSNVIASGGTFQLGTGYWGAFSNSSQSVGVTVAGGTFVEYGNFAGLTSQPFNNGLTVNSGASTFTVTNNGDLGTVVTLAAVGSRAVGGTVNFNLPAGAQTAANGITTAQLNTNGILGGYATVGGTDWASNATNTSGGNIIGLSASAINSYTPDAWAAGNNTDVTTSDAPAAGSTTNSLRFNASGANTLTLGGTNTVTSGGILVTPNVGGNPTTITGGTLEGSTTDLILIQNNTAGGLTISSTIANNGTSALTKSGPGLLTLTGTNTYTGALYLNGGTLNAATANINGSSATNGIVFNGGTLQAAAGGITTAKAVSMGVNGGTVDTSSANVTFSGALTNAANTGLAGAGAYGGFVATGVGALTEIGGGTLLLSGTNTFGGGVIINNGTVQNGKLNALGTGYVTFGASNTPTLDLFGFNATVAGLISSGSNGVVTNSAAAASTLTLDGVISQSYGGVIRDGGSASIALAVNLYDAGAIQAFSGANAYSGGTTISQGTLLANNTSGSATGSGAVTIAKPGILGGTGTITGGSVTVNGTITAGTGATSASTTGLLTTTGGTAGATTASQVWNGGGTYAWKVNPTTASPAASASNVNGVGTTDSSPGSNWDMLAINTLSIQSTPSSPFVINLVPTTSGALGSSNPYTIADVISGNVTIGGTTTNYSGNPSGLTSALQALQASGALLLNVPSSMGNSSALTLSAISDGGSASGDDIVVSYSPAPEPTSLMLLGLGAGGLMLRRRRRAGSTQA